jgi:hypothetical protein
MPDIASAIAHWIQIDYPGGHGVFGMVEQFQPNAAGTPAEDGEIGPSPGFQGSQGQG